MKLGDSLNLYIGLTKIMRACIGVNQVWPTYYLWTTLGINAFSDAYTAQGLSMSVAKTSSGKTRIAIGLPTQNSDRGRIRVFEFSIDLLSFVEMTFAGAINVGQDLGTNQPLSYGKTLSLSKNGLYLVVGGPTALNMGDTNGVRQGFVRVLTCDVAASQWSLHGIHYDQNGISSLTGYIYGLTYSYVTRLFGWSVAIEDSGSVIYVGSPQTETVNQQYAGVVFKFSKSATTQQWVSSALYRHFNRANSTPYFWGFFGKDIRLSGSKLLVSTGENQSTFVNNGTLLFSTANVTELKVYSDASANGTDNVGLNNSLALSNDGAVAAIGFPKSSSSRGKVSVFSTESPYAKIGSDITGQIINSRIGSSVSLNNDGTILAIGSNGYDFNGVNNGSVVLYKRNLVTGVWKWSKYSDQLTGADGDQAGYCVDLNLAGDTVFFTSPYANSGALADRGKLTIAKLEL